MNTILIAVPETNLVNLTFSLSSAKPIINRLWQRRKNVKTFFFLLPILEEDLCECTDIWYKTG